MLCNAKKDNWQIGTGSIHAEGRLVSGFRFVNWVHEASNLETRAVPTLEATSTVYGQIEQWLLMQDRETDSVLVLTTRPKVLSTCKAFFSSRAGGPMLRQQSRLRAQQPNIVSFCMENPPFSVALRVAMMLTTSATRELMSPSHGSNGIGLPCQHAGHHADYASSFSAAAWCLHRLHQGPTDKQSFCTRPVPSEMEVGL